MYTVYSLTGSLLLILLLPFFYIVGIWNKRHRDNIGQRLGDLKTIAEEMPRRGPRIWIHAASVGEVSLAKIIIDRLSQMAPGVSFCLSTVTETGKSAASRQLPEIPRFLAPIDISWIVKRSLRHMRPTLYVCLETELWPAFIKKMKEGGIPAILLNGRITQRSFKKYLLVRRLIKDTLSSFQAISAIHSDDAERFLSLGAEKEKIFVHGNAKYDTEIDARDMTMPDYHRHLLCLSRDDTIFLCGSTRGGEEKILLDAYRTLVSRIPRLIFILAPRHIQRRQELAELMEHHGISFHLFSELRQKKRHHQVVLVDTIGDLRGLYSIGTYIFVGGSLVDRGGHNMMEAAFWGKPVMYGPYTRDFQDAVAMLEMAGAGFRIQSSQELIDLILRFEHSPLFYEKTAEQARNAALSQVGSARRQVALVIDALQKISKETIAHESSYCT